MKKSDTLKDFVAVVKELLSVTLIVSFIFFVLDLIVRKPAHIPAKIEEVYYTSSGEPVARTTTCNAYYVSFLKVTKRYNHGVSLCLDKHRTGCVMICRSGLQDYPGYSYYHAWLDSLKYVSLKRKGQKGNWLTFAGKQLTIYFENGDTLQLFPYNNKIYYDKKYYKTIHAYYEVTPKCRELLTQQNIIRMKMDYVFDQDHIRPELREELIERFELVDNYVFEAESDKR